MQFSSFLWKDVKDRRKRRESFCSLLTIIITELKFNSKWSLTFRWRTTQPWAASFTIHCCWRNTFWKFANWWVMGIQMLKTSTKVWQKVPNWSGEAIADHPMVGFAFTSHTSGHDFLSSFCTVTKKSKIKKNISEKKKKEGFSPYCQCWLPPCLKALLIPTFSPCVFLWVREANLANCIFVEEKSKPSHRLHLILTLDRILDQPDEEHFTGFYEIKKFSGRLNKIFIKAKKQLFKNAKIRYGF